MKKQKKSKKITSVDQKKLIKQKIRRRRSLHKKFLMHPSFLFLLLCVGVLLVGLTMKAFAVSLTVSAKVSAPLITTPAVIQIITPKITTATSRPAAAIPSNVTTGVAPTQDAKTPETAINVIEKTITLTGECPKNSHLEFYKNGTLAGVAPCIGDPTFSIELDLVPGMNAISAKVYNITGDEGPISQTLYANYESLVPASTTSAETSGALAPIKKTSKTTPLSLTTNFTNLGFYVNQEGQWKINITGGTAPYIIDIDWGNNEKTQMVQITDGDFNIKHTYTRASDTSGYVITIRAIDSKGSPATLQLMSIISDKGSPMAGKVDQANAKQNPSFANKFKRWSVIAWPAYLVLGLMIISFWLGEREEYKKLIAGMPRKHRWYST